MTRHGAVAGVLRHLVNECSVIRYTNQPRTAEVVH